MNWLVLTFFAIASRATYSIATKILSKDVTVSPVTHSLLLTTFAGLLSLVIAHFIGGISFAGVSNHLFAVSVMVVSQAVGNVLFFKGIQKLDAGTTQIAFSSILIWSTLLAIFFLDSVFSSTQVIGILLMLVAILIVQYKKGKIDFNKSTLYILGSALMFALFQISSANISTEINTGAYLVLAYFGPSLLIGSLYYKKIKNDYSLISAQLKQTTVKTVFAIGIFI